MSDASEALPGVQLLVRDGDGTRLITTLDEALAYVEAQTDAPHANREGVIFRLESAHTPEEKHDAANAFRGWLDATGRLIEARAAR